MLKKRRKAGLLAFIIILSFLEGCGTEEEPEQEYPKSLKIGISVYDQYDTFMAEVLYQLQSYVREKEKEWGIPVTLDIQDAGQDQLQQNKQMEDFIEEGCDLVCINMVDRTDASSVIEKAKSNDIPVIFYNRELVKEDLQRWEKLYYVGADALQSGELQGQILVEQCKKDFSSIDKNGDGVLQYIMLEGEAGHNDSMIRSMSVIKEITDSGYVVEKLADEIANWNRDQAANNMASFIEDYGDRIEVVLANNDDMALGAVDALKDSGIIPGTKSWPMILGIDGTDVGRKAVEKGEFLGTVLNDARGQARGMIELAWSIVSDTPLDSELELQEGKYIRLPYQKVTGENLSEIQKRERQMALP